MARLDLLDPEDGRSALGQGERDALDDDTGIPGGGIWEAVAGDEEGVVSRDEDTGFVGRRNSLVLVEHLERRRRPEKPLDGVVMADMRGGKGLKGRVSRKSNAGQADRLQHLARK
ncbi:hypothetical protein E4U43_002482 [Claviceps pusilla]|uniref:Uncharacterized protein n=1 Tax=Claviceps pusilla TaxID=123648 RepID=A0A9P7N6T6_9HYPO|nr:hypothetical protein E4U43_002482 [Claviceps pusilla]